MSERWTERGRWPGIRAENECWINASTARGSALRAWRAPTRAEVAARKKRFKSKSGWNGPEPREPDGETPELGEQDDGGR
jgi:hypothetical protein